MVMKIFKGKTATLSGRFPSLRSVYEETIQSRGGTISSWVTDKTDFLISTREDVEEEKTKVLLAMGRGIPIVTQYWIMDSAKAGKLLEMDKYLIPTKKRLSAAARAKLAKAAAAAAAAAPVPTPARAETAKKTKSGPVLKGKAPSATSPPSAAAVNTCEGGKPARWQYYAERSRHWGDCHPGQVAEMEKFYKKHERDGRQETRFIQSGDGMWHEIDFAELLQTNPKTGKRRVLRRLEGGVTPSDEPPKKIPEDAEPDPSWKDKVDKQVEDSEAEPEGDDGDKAEDEEMEDEEEASEPAAKRGRKASTAASSSNKSPSKASTAASSSKNSPSFRGGRTAPSATASSASASAAAVGARSSPTRGNSSSSRSAAANGPRSRSRSPPVRVNKPQR